MLKNLIFKTTLCAALCLLVFANGNAQQARSLHNNPFIQLQAPLSEPARSNMIASALSVHTPYRTYDGTNNNIGSSQKMLYGSANIPLYREIPSAYASADPKNAMNGITRPSPRRISNVVIDEPVTHFSERELSAFVYVWGQFVDHDITLTPSASTEYAPIALPVDEVVFTEPIPFYRSEVRAGTGTTNARQQSNLNSSWLDGSVVYGSETTRANWMRTFSRGKDENINR